MAISQETLMKKIKEEVSHAEQHIHTDQFSVYIGKLHVLCELLLDESHVHENKQQVQKNEIPEQMQGESQPLTQQGNPELLEGDSIFDF